MINFPMPRLFTILALTSLTIIVFGGTGCQKQANPPEKITIAYSTSFNAVLVHIAFAKDYFREEGLDATPQPHTFGKVALQAVFEGKADLATTADTPIMFAIMGGKKITTLAVIQTANRNTGIVARRDRGIVKPADLRGKTIGITLGTTVDFFTDSFLLVYGINRTQVKFIDMKPEEMAGAIATGIVDAVAAWNPFLIQVQKQLGSKGIVFFGESIYTEIFCLVALQEYVKKNPAAIKKVMRALLKAETFIQRHPAEARRLVAEFVRTDATILEEVWDIYQFRVTLDQPLLVDLEEQTRWAIKQRLTAPRHMPNYLDYIYIDGLLAVKPEAVRIIR